MILKGQVQDRAVKNIVKLHHYDHKNRIDICNNGTKVLQYTGNVMTD